MSTKFFDFNLPDDSPLPEGLERLDPANEAYKPIVKIQNNQLKTNTVNGSYGALVVYDTGDPNGIVRGTVKASTNTYARGGVVFRAQYSF